MFGLHIDATFFAFVALVIFLGVMARLGVFGKIGAALDGRAKAINDELDEARKLREDAQDLLAKFQRKQRDADDEVQEIIEQARRDAENLMAESREKITEQLNQRTKLAEEKIQRAEEQALAEVKNIAVEVAVSAAKTLIAEKMDDATQAKLLERGVSELSAKIN